MRRETSREEERIAASKLLHDAIEFYGHDWRYGLMERIQKQMDEEREVMKNITYGYRGQVERGNRLTGYKMVAGYSEDSRDGRAAHPFMTISECIEDAKRQGGKAVFYTGPAHASRFEPDVV